MPERKWSPNGSIELMPDYLLQPELSVSQRSRAFQFVLLSLFTIFFVLWLQDPPYQLHAMIHVVPTWVAVAILLASIRFFAISNTSFALVVGFLSLHVLGTRYVYSYVPYDQWSLQVFGATISETLQLNRNHYDRVVHFSYGLLIAPVARELIVRLTQVISPWSHLAAIQFVLASSMLFELAEWGGAICLAPEFADSYLGQQGDPWDAHKDMALAAVGSVLSMLVAAIIGRITSHRRCTNLAKSIDRPSP